MPPPVPEAVQENRAVADKARMHLQFLFMKNSLDFLNEKRCFLYFSMM